MPRFRYHYKGVILAHHLSVSYVLSCRLNTLREALTSRVLFEVGSLSFGAPKIMLALEKEEPHVLRNFVRVVLHGEHRLVCQTKQTREMWGELLLSAYG